MDFRIGVCVFWMWGYVRELIDLLMSILVIYLEEKKGVFVNTFEIWF